jgi:hypothetical protein
LTGRKLSTRRTIRKAREVIEAVAELNGLLEKPVYRAADKERMVQLVEILELNRFDEGPFALVRKIR